jgi:hypothetical protein
MAFKVKYQQVNSFSTTSTAKIGVNLLNDSGGSFTHSLPSAIGLEGEIIVVIKTNSSANTITVDPNGSETINGSASESLVDQWDTLVLVSDNSNWVNLLYPATTGASSGGFTLATKTTNFTANDGGNYYYRMTTNNMTVTLPASPADGSVRKFKMVTAGKTATFAFNGAETINHADGISNQILTLTSDSGVLELIAVSGGWDET